MKRRRGAGVAAGDCVGVFVESGRDALVIEPTGNDHDRDAGVKHLGGHEVSEVVQSERTEPGGATVAEERLGHPVRLPRGGPALVAEHETVRRDAQLERTGAALADRALDDRIIGRSRPKLMGHNDTGTV
jgi:hypothetical protein